MNFSNALNALKMGQRVTRVGWHGKNMHLALKKPDEKVTGFDDMSMPFIYLATTEGSRVPWVASQTDLLEEDWEIA